MESFLNRYRNITVLLLVIFAQLVLLAVQVKNDQNVRFIRVWSVTAVSPFARLMGGLHGSSLFSGPGGEVPPKNIRGSPSFTSKPYAIAVKNF